MDLKAGAQAADELVIRARRVSVDVEDGHRHVGFAEGDEDEPYALFAQPLAGGPVRLELNDPLFAAEGAIATLALQDDALVLQIAPAASAALGFARRVRIHLPRHPAPDRDAALAALARMHPFDQTDRPPGD